jgi:hypothetical protein
MQHCLQYLLLYGILLGSLAAGYANYQLLYISNETFAHLAAALTAGRPVFGFVGWLLVNHVHRRSRRSSAVEPLKQACARDMSR